jgi:glycosyltransferase involved in cell wall biosynthesis
MKEFKLPPEIGSWLDSFRRKHGRTPRVLHIGNIANNAYNNAKMLNKAGLDCDVICYDYYHIMGCPEWEDADFQGEIQDQFFPDWTSVDLKGFQRPRWFAQGPFELCANYLIARKTNKTNQAAVYWNLLGTANKTQIRSAMSWNVFPFFFFEKFRIRSVALIRRLGVLMRDVDVVATLTRKLKRHFPLHKSTGAVAFIATMIVALLIVLLLKIAVISYLQMCKVWNQLSPKQKTLTTEEALIELFKKTFPTRNDQLTIPDLSPYRSVIPKWRQLFGHYDLVQAYATDPLLPLLANKHPYIGFEHGTLRTFTLADNAVCRLTSLAYNQADHVFITNGDCLQYALNIGVKRYTPMLHPFDEDRIRSAPSNSLGFRERFGVKYVFLCTLRHDWAVKGTDKYIRALPLIASAIGADFKLVMTKWGAELDASRELAKSLDVAHLIEWIEPLNRHTLFKAQKSVDILFDQLALPHFGATAPEGIAAGVPVIMSYNPTSTEWIVAEPAPILSAFTVDDIAKAVRTALDPEWLASYRERSREWIDKFHSSRIVVERHLNAYRQVIPA